MDKSGCLTLACGFKGLYENSIIYKKQGGDWGCCNAGFAFMNGDYFLRTKIWSDLIMIEDCNE
jgi:hypothetical protein